MHSKKSVRFVLLLDQERETARRSATQLAGDDAYVLMARTPAAALEFARQYKPSHVVIDQRYSYFDGKFLPELLLEFSPDTEVVLVSEESPRALGQNAWKRNQQARWGHHPEPRQ